MAYTVSDKYKNKIYAESSFSDLKIYINNEEIDTDYVIDIQLDDDCFEDESFTLGSAIYQKIVLKLGNECLPCTIKEINTFKITYGIEFDDGTKEWIPIGEYVLGKEPDTTYSDYTIFTLYDYMSKFDVEYDGSSKVPCTRAELLTDICQSVGVELATTTFLGSDRIVGTYDNTITARQYLSFISERAGGFAKIGRDKKLYIKCYADVDVIELSDTESASAVINSYDVLKSITKVFYEDALNKWEFGNDTGIVIQLSDSSPFAITEEEVESIYNKLNGLSFQSLDVKMWGDPAYDTGDIISVYGYKTFIQKSWKYNNGFYGSYKTILKESNSISNVEKISLSSKIKRLKTKLDEETGRIDILAEETNENSSNIGALTIESSEIKEQVSSIERNLDNTYTKEQTEELILNAKEGLTNTFTKIGGNNLLKNSALYFKKDNIYDFWSGNAEKIIYSDAQSNTAISLKNSSFKQSISLANNDYTLSFKYKRLNSLGSANVKINNETISLEETGEIKKTLSITTNQFEIEFNSTLDDSYIIYDLMLNVGTDASPWSQYANEIHTDTVNISKGITVEATENDTIGSLGADGLKVINKYTNEKVLKATDTGVETPEIIAKTGTMGGVSIKKTGNQSWIVGV